MLSSDEDNLQSTQSRQVHTSKGTITLSESQAHDKSPATNGSPQSATTAAAT